VSTDPIQVLKVGGCLVCGEDLKCTIKDVLYQPDYGGNDYEDVRCREGERGRGRERERGREGERERGGAFVWNQLGLLWL
jgi:hypothetical protein